jgi:hypothetical protein
MKAQPMGRASPVFNLGNRCSALKLGNRNNQDDEENGNKGEASKDNKNNKSRRGR